VSVSNEVRDRTELINQKEEGIIFGEFKAPIALESKCYTFYVIEIFYSISLQTLLLVFFST
jgi:hypothetical protein